MNVQITCLLIVHSCLFAMHEKNEVNQERKQQIEAETMCATVEFTLIKLLQRNLITEMLALYRSVHIVRAQNINATKRLKKTHVKQ